MESCIGGFEERHKTILEYFVEFKNKWNSAHRLSNSMQNIHVTQEQKYRRAMNIYCTCMNICHVFNLSLGY